MLLAGDQLPSEHRLHERFRALECVTAGRDHGSALVVRATTPCPADPLDERRSRLSPVETGLGILALWVAVLSGHWRSQARRAPPNRLLPIFTPDRRSPCTPHTPRVADREEPTARRPASRSRTLERPALAL